MELPKFILGDNSDFSRPYTLFIQIFPIYFKCRNRRGRMVEEFDKEDMRI